MIRVGVFGATGYAGRELARILAGHPEVEIVFGTSRDQAGRDLGESYALAPDLTLVDPDQAPIGDVDFLFLCLPHTSASSVAVEGLGAGSRVIDLSADFRLEDPAQFQAWYGQAHPHPDLLPRAVYGLTELVRDELAGSMLVANPGCYPTSALLALYPLARAGALAGTVIIDAKSGVSGAGRTPQQHLHFVEVAENVSPYKVGHRHRHVPEIEQALDNWTSRSADVVFSPHLVPIRRGLLSTIYSPLGTGWTEARVREAYQSAYGGESFLRVLPAGQHAAVADVEHTNRCVIGISVVGELVVLTSAIDNLVKGAAGQAVQNMNVMAGLNETLGLA